MVRSEAATRHAAYAAGFADVAAGVRDWAVHSFTGVGAAQSRTPASTSSNRAA